MLGTAFPAARLLLVEQPGAWGERGLRDSAFGLAAAEALEATAVRFGVRVQAVRRPGRTPRDAVHRWALIDTRDGRESLRWGTYATPDELIGLPFDESPGTPDEAPLYLVCAHSKHDTCCALRGRPVAAALAALRPGRVWECSHLGGDRFAANVLVLPSGLLYGRVLPFAAEEFIAAAEADEVVGALLRGRIGLPAPAQAALAFAHEHLAVRARRDLSVVASGPVADGAAVVRLRGPHGLLDVTRAGGAGGRGRADLPQPASEPLPGLPPGGHRPRRVVAFPPGVVDFRAENQPHQAGSGSSWLPSPPRRSTQQGWLVLAPASTQVTIAG